MQDWDMFKNMGEGSEFDPELFADRVERMNGLIEEVNELKNKYPDITIANIVKSTEEAAALEAKYNDAKFMDEELKMMTRMVFEALNRKNNEQVSIHIILLSEATQDQTIHRNNYKTLMQMVRDIEMLIFEYNASFILPYEPDPSKDLDMNQFFTDTTMDDLELLGRDSESLGKKFYTVDLRLAFE